MEKKYELVKEDKIEWAGRTLHRIRALKDFSDVKKGDFGGYIEMEENLSQEGSAWVYGTAEVYGSAWVCGSAEVQEDEDYMLFGSFGSEGRTTTIYRTKTGFEVKCGCFNGTLEEFRAKVKETHGDNQHAKEYLAIADIAEMRFGKERENNAADRS